MNTPAHLIFGAASFAKPHQKGTLPAALFGGMVPDLSLYLMVGWHLFVLNTSPQVVFDQLYFSDQWQAIFAIDNSVFVWGAVLAFALWRKSPVLMAFAGAALLHIALDFPLHAGDGRPHFWPVTMWVFDSPLSYWDSTYFAWIIGPLEFLACLILVIILWRRYVTWPLRILFAVLLLAQGATNNIWFLVF